VRMLRRDDLFSQDAAAALRRIDPKTADHYGLP
jgi:hypothetical protein